MLFLKNYSVNLKINGNFIQAKFEDYNSGGAYQKAVRTDPPIRSQGTVM